jgi:hypothetical protein
MMEIGSDGSIFVTTGGAAGTVRISKISSAGVPDPTFATNGTLELPLTRLHSWGVQSDSKVVAYRENSTSQWDQSMVRFLANGQPDTSFINPVLGQTICTSCRVTLRISADDRILVHSRVLTPSGHVRKLKFLLSNGAVDPLRSEIPTLTLNPASSALDLIHLADDGTFYAVYAVPNYDKVVRVLRQERSTSLSERRALCD